MSKDKDSVLRDAVAELIGPDHIVGRVLIIAEVIDTESGAVFHESTADLALWVEIGMLESVLALVKAKDLQGWGSTDG